jgi:hypothetical protein
MLGLTAEAGRRTRRLPKTKRLHCAVDRQQRGDSGRCPQGPERPCPVGGQGPGYRRLLFLRSWFCTGWDQLFGCIWNSDGRSKGRRLAARRGT